MKENRLLFTNALIVLPTETINGSLAVEDGKITGIFESGTELPGFTEVDVHGKALMPGAIDTHVHMWDPLRSITAKIGPVDPSARHPVALQQLLICH